MKDHNQAQLIALDWGTSSCRAYLMGESGVVLSERLEPFGVMAVSARAAALGTPREVAFGQTFEAMCGGWLESQPGLPVIASGMIGSNHGWVEAEYRQVPTDLAADGIVLTPALTRAGTTVHIVPGLMVSSALPGVMRGEETQILGALMHDLEADRLGYAAERIVLLPGTHSKWVRVSGTTVTDFATCMTGEIYALLTTDSTLSRLAIRPDRPEWEAFDRGLAIAASPTGHGGILNTVFSARTLVMTGKLAQDQVEDYLSGLLIGHELAGVATSWLGDQRKPILLCGNPNLNDRYRRALERLGVRVEEAVSHCAAAGMWHVAVTTGLVRDPRKNCPTTADATHHEPEIDVERLDSAYSR